MIHQCWTTEVKGAGEDFTNILTGGLYEGSQPTCCNLEPKIFATCIGSCSNCPVAGSRTTVGCMWWGHRVSLTTFGI